MLVLYLITALHMISTLCQAEWLRALPALAAGANTYSAIEYRLLPALRVLMPAGIKVGGCVRGALL